MHIEHDTVPEGPHSSYAPERVTTLSLAKALIGMALTGVVALSVHVFMLQNLHIPYPSRYPHSGLLPSFLTDILVVFGLFIYYGFVMRTKALRSGSARLAFVFFSYVMLKEDLFRITIMNGICSTAWAYSILETMSRLIAPFLMCALVAISARKLTSWPLRACASLVIAAFLAFIANPWISQLSKPFLKHFAYLSHPDIYVEPYGLHVLVPAYLTFAEPVIACFAIAIVIFSQLRSYSWSTYVGFALLVMTLKGLLLAPFINIFYAAEAPLIAFESVLQFSLEAFVLGVLTAFTFAFSTRQAGLKTAKTNKHPSQPFNPS